RRSSVERERQSTGRPGITLGAPTCNSRRANAPPLALAPDPTRDEVSARLLVPERALEALVPLDHLSREIAPSRLVERLREGADRPIVLHPELPGALARPVTEAVGSRLEPELEARAEELAQALGPTPREGRGWRRRGRRR